MRRTSKRSSLSSKRRRSASGPVAPRTTTSATRCRNSEPRAFCDAKSKRPTLNVQRSTPNSGSRGRYRDAVENRVRRPRGSRKVHAHWADFARHRFVAGRQDRHGEESVRGRGNGIRVRVCARRVVGRAKAERPDPHDRDPILAADAVNPIAVAKIFEAKGRPRFDPLIVHLPDRDWLEKVADLPTQDRQLVLKLAEKFWPGPFTMVLPKRDAVPEIVTAGLETVAVRISAHPVFAQIVETFGKPLAAPSANRFGRISPTTARHVLDALGGQIPLTIDAGPRT